MPFSKFVQFCDICTSEINKKNILLLFIEMAETAPKKFEFKSRHLSILLGMVALAFIVATAVLAVEKSVLENNLIDSRYKLDKMESLLESTLRPINTPNTPEASKFVHRVFNFKTPIE
ncbi:uncharacterized protein LOC129953737 [Eupeodes corollae]|uniref:uncharacterized protein LOC129953737 n=1 Tax=Eupeodes corollae TaxID=290404 RepID=UPI0024926820|nr:uncharacterized protein LOC129953737 [Eupeodes corollae]